MAAKGGRLRADPIEQAAEPGAGVERFAGRPGGLARGKIPRLERLRGGYRNPFYKGRAPDPHHDLLGHRVNRPVVPNLLRFRECRRADLDKRGREEMGRVIQSASGVRSFPRGYKPSTA